MTINELVNMAKRIHDTEGYNLGASSTREYRNAFWARVLGCAYHGHPVYNPNPDKQWHLKNGGGGRPQTDDVAVSMPSRNYWDCIVGVGSNGYYFNVGSHADTLPIEQEVYAPPVPAGSGGNIPEPEPEPEPTPDYSAMLSEIKTTLDNLTAAFKLHVQNTTVDYNNIITTLNTLKAEIENSRKNTTAQAENTNLILSQGIEAIRNHQNKGRHKVGF